MVLLGIGAHLPLASQDLTTLREMGTEAWLEDLDHLSATIKLKHKNAFHFTTEQVFDHEVRGLRERIPSLETHQILVEFGRIAALIGDGHTSVRAYQYFHLFPLTFYWFGEDLRVIRTDSESQDLLGWKVIAVGSVPVKDARDRVHVLTAGNENTYFFMGWSPYWLKNADALHTLGIIEGRATATYTFESAAGERRQVVFTSLSNSAYQEIEWVHAYDPKPAFIAREDDPLWTDLDINHNLLYVGFNGYPAWKYVREITKGIIEQIEEYNLRTLVVDFRQNGGGNFDKGLHMIKHLKKIGFHEKGKVIVLTSRYTFSAAMSNASHFKYQMNALLVGEPPGERPNGYAENYSYELPNSKLEASCSIRYYTFWDEDIPEMIMDVPFEPDFETWKQGKDPVMEWVLRQQR